MKALCARYGVSPSTGKRWICRAAFGDLDRRHNAGRVRNLPPGALDDIRSILTARPDTRLRDLRDTLSWKYSGVSMEAIRCAIVDDLDYSFATAKRRWIAVSRKAVDRFAELFNRTRRVYGFKLEDVVFVDEVSKDGRAAAPTEARGAAGAPNCCGDDFPPETPCSLLMFFSLKGIEYWTYTEGAFDSAGFEEAFADFMRRQRRPRLVVLDGARIHWTESLRKLYDGCDGAILRLPPYCPFLNPLGQVFAELQRFLARERGDASSSFVSKACRFVEGLDPETSLRAIMGHGYYHSEFVPVKFREDWLFARDPVAARKRAMLQEALARDRYRVPHRLLGWAVVVGPGERRTECLVRRPAESSAAVCRGTAPPGGPLSYPSSACTPPATLASPPEKPSRDPRPGPASPAGESPPEPPTPGEESASDCCLDWGADEDLPLELE